MKPEILIVEDGRIVAMDIQMSLEAMGYTVSGIASSGEEAINKTAKLLPDLVIMDINLKGEMDGIEAASVIKEMFDIPVIYLTAYTDLKTLERAKITEPFAYITKPFEERELHSNIEIALYKAKLEQKVKESEKKLRIITDNINDLIFQIDTNGVIQYVSPSSKAVLGYDAIDLESNSFFANIHPSNLVEVEECFLQKPRDKSNAKSCIKEFRYMNNDGYYLWLSGSSNLLFNDKGKLEGAIISARDITAKKEADMSLVQSHQTFLSVLDGLDALVYAADLYNHEILFINKYGRQLYGSVKGRKCWQVLYPDKEGPCNFCINKKMLDDLEKGKDYNYVWQSQEHKTKLWFQRRDCFIKWLDGRTVRLEIATDITGLKKAEEKLRYLSMHDQLTGVYNRTYFEEEIKRLEKGREYPISIISADMDGLKIVNDVLGHEEGDKLIKDCSNILKNLLRAGDFTARIGGDEFVVILPWTDIKDTLLVIDRIKTAIETYNNEKDNFIPLSISMGYATCKENSKTMEETLKESDDMMYNNKLSQSPVYKKKLLELLKLGREKSAIHLQRIAQAENNI